MPMPFREASAGIACITLFVVEKQGRRNGSCWLMGHEYVRKLTPYGNVLKTALRPYQDLPFPLALAIIGNPGVRR